MLIEKSAPDLPSSPFVVAVVLNWNRWRDTVRCIESLDAQNYRKLGVVIVDNNSADDSVAQLRARFPGHQLIANSHNYGFGKGCNYGIRSAIEFGADYIWLLNNDAIAASNALSELVLRSASDPTVGQVGSVIKNFHAPQVCLAWGGGRINALLGLVKHSSTQIEDSRLHFLTAASVLLPVHTLSSVGLFDENFFLYWEDVDLSFRIRKAGFKLTVAPRSLIYHAESSSLGKGNPRLDFVFSQSAKKFFKKHALIPTIPIALNLVSRCLNRLRKGEFKRLYNTFWGFFSEKHF